MMTTVKQKQSMALFAEVIRGPESQAMGLSNEDLGAVAYWNADPDEMARFKAANGIEGTITLDRELS